MIDGNWQMEERALDYRRLQVYPQDQEAIFQINATYSRLFNSCFANSSICEFVSVPFLKMFSNPYSQDYTDDLNGDRISLGDLWTNLLSEGMQHPFRIRVCINPLSLRLETGNQRINIFTSKGIHWVPCDLEIAATPIGNKGNGVHYVSIDRGTLTGDHPLKLGLYKPSSILRRSFEIS